MNKTKIILAGTGGAIGLIVLVLAFLVWQSFSAKTVAIEGDDEEGTEGLETVVGRAETLSRKPVYPCKESVTAIEGNLTTLNDWRKEGLSLATQGDRVYEKTTAPKFKAFLVSDARRLAMLPGSVGGKLVKPEFGFGPFVDYITGGKMPSEEELPTLQRKWDDVATVAELLATNGVVELLDVGFAAADEEQAAKKDQVKGKKTKVVAKKNAGGNKSREPRTFSYAFSFSARPAAFIGVLNALEANKRFMVVENFSFSRPTDAIAEAFGADEKKAAEAQAMSRRGRRGRRGVDAAAEKTESADSNKNGVVTDPLQDAPMTVTMTVKVCDFRSLEEEQTEEVGK